MIESSSVGEDPRSGRRREPGARTAGGGQSRRHPRCVRRAARIFAPALLALAVGACCVPAPRAEKYFARDWPTSTLRGFVYAVEAHQWDFAYESLSAESREMIGPLRFEVGLRLFDDPVLDVSVYDLVVSALHHVGSTQVSADESWAVIKVTAKVSSEDEPSVYREMDVIFVHEEGEWRVDFAETARRLRGDTPPPDTIGPELTRG